LGIGNWGLGIGDWGLGIDPNPQPPIPNPQSPIPIQKKYKAHLKINIKKLKYIYKKLLFYIIYIIN